MSQVNLGQVNWDLNTQGIRCPCGWILVISAGRQSQKGLFGGGMLSVDS